MLTGIQWTNDPLSQLYISIYILKTIDSAGLRGYLSALHYSKRHMIDYTFLWTSISFPSEKTPFPRVLICSSIILLEVILWQKMKKSACEHINHRVIDAAITRKG